MDEPLLIDIKQEIIEPEESEWNLQENHSYESSTFAESNSNLPETKTTDYNVASIIKVENVKLESEDFELDDFDKVVDMYAHTEFVEIKVEPSAIHTEDESSETNLHPHIDCKTEVDIDSDTSSEIASEDDHNFEEPSLSNKDISCKICKGVLSSLKEHTLHMKDKHMPIILAYYEDIRNYIGTQEGYKPLKCEICGKGYRLELLLKNHLLGHRGLCHICYYTTNSYLDLKKHLQIHNRFKCDKCDYTSSRKHGITRHMKKHLQMKMNQCDFCNYSCNKAADLQNHLNSHSIKQYSCDVCSFKGYDKLELNSHVAQHVKGKQLNCRTCSFICFGWRDMKKHMNEHMRKETLQQKCSLCDFSTVSKKNLRQHMRIHPKDKSWICNVCKRGYAGVNELRKHMKRHMRS